MVVRPDQGMRQADDRWCEMDLMSLIKARRKLSLAGLQKMRSILQVKELEGLVERDADECIRR